jgi:hypothetical protein
MIQYATRLPPGKPVELLDNNLIRKTYTGSEKWFEYMDALIKHFINNPDPLVVPIYNYQVLSKRRDCFYRTEYTYCYDMMRCGILSVDERWCVDHIGNLWNKFNKKACDQKTDGIALCKKQFPKLFEFLKTVVEQNRYFDLHSENVMMDEDRNYVLVDLESFIKTPLESFIKTPLELECNNWITR